MAKIGFSLQPRYDLPMEQVIALIKEAGFDALSPVYTTPAALDAAAVCAQAQGLSLQSLHAPLHVAPMWQKDTAAAQEILSAIKDSADCCAKLQIPTLVVHSWQGLVYTFPGEPLHYGNFDELVEYARQKNVSIAFENLEGEEYLAALMARYTTCAHVGFCWDSGHGNCYPHRLDFIKEFGDRLIMTHLHDNFGLRDPGGVPSGKDDLHLLPGDGTAGKDFILDALANAKRQDTLNFELKLHPHYAHVPLDEFLKKAARCAREMADTYEKG